MNNVVLVGMSEGGYGLAGQIQRTRGRYPAFDTIGERLLTKFHRYYEMVVDVEGRRLCGRESGIFRFSVELLASVAALSAASGGGTKLVRNHWAIIGCSQG
jgi:hypothetical protein